MLFRLRNTITLFNEVNIVANFRSLWQKGFTHRVARRGTQVAQFNASEAAFNLPENFTFEGTQLNTLEFLQSHWTTGMVILKVPDPEKKPTQATLLYEQYFRGNDASSKCISWSMGKSIVGALFGVAIAQGKIGSLDDMVTDYLPEFAGSGYDGVILKNVLQMSTGVAFTEDYERFFSDVNRMGRTLALGYSVNGLAASLCKEYEQGTHLHYNSMNTQVLGAVLSKVIAPQKLTEYLEEQIWTKVGFEDDVFWLLDNDMDEMELAFGTFNARTRDFARFGWLYLNGGRSPLDGSQILLNDWVKKSVTPDDAHLQPGVNEGYNLWGYGYHIWVLGREDDPTQVAGDYAFVGIYNQFVYVSPQHNVVIARNSAYPDYGTGDDLPSEAKAIACFRAIAEHSARCKE